MDEAAGRQRAERWLQRAGERYGGGVRARRAWRRLAAEALRGEPEALALLTRVARDPEHPRSRQAGDVIADRWAATDDPDLRQTVLDTGALATSGLPRFRTAALHGRLHAPAHTHWTRYAVTLLHDTDGDVRNGVAEACRTANKWLTYELWRETLRPDGPSPYLGSVPAVSDWWLFDTLLTRPSPPPPSQLEELWVVFLQPVPAGAWRSRGPGGGLLPALTRWGVTHWDHLGWGTREALSQVVLEPDAGRLLAYPGTRRALIEAAGYTEHPLAELARERILAIRDRPAGGGSGVRRRPAQDRSGAARGTRSEPSAHGSLSLLADFVDDLCEHALGHAELLSWCVTHRFTPSLRDPARRAAFLLRTGRPEPVRDAVPGGGPTAQAYADAPPDAPGRALRWAGGPGLAEIVLGAAGGEERGRRVEELTDAELAHLAGWLDAEDRLPDLWRLVRDLPLARGHRLLPLLAARHARDGSAAEPRDAWRPGDEAGRRLLARLRAIDPETLAAGLAALERDWPAGYHVARIRFRGRVNDLSFAPDAPLLAVATSNRAAGVIDLHRGELVERYDGFVSSVGHVAHVGGGAFVAAERTSSPGGPCRLVHCAGGRSRLLRRWPGPVTSLTPTGAGRFVAGTRSGHLLFVAPAGAGAGAGGGTGPGAGGEVADAVPVPELAAVSVAAFGLIPGADWPRALASDPYTGRVAVCGRRLLLAEWAAEWDPESAPVAEEHGASGPGPGPYPGARTPADHGTAPGPFLHVLAEGRRAHVTSHAVLTGGPAALAVYERHRGVVEVLRHEGRALRPVGSADHVAAMTALPGRGQLATVDRHGKLQLLDADTLSPCPGAMPQPPDAPRRSGLGPVTSLHAAPDGGLLAVGYAGGVTDLYDVRHGEVPSLAARPLAYARPAHVDALTAALDVPGLARPTREVLRLLLALLSHRFPRDGDGTGAGGGGSTTLSAGGYDIAL